MEKEKTSVSEDVEKWEPLCTVGENDGTAGVENNIEVPQKIKNKTTYDPAILLLCIYPKELKAGSQRDLCTLMFTAALFTIVKRWKQPKCSSMNENG